jgi:hypothetical protein
MANTPGICATFKSQCLLAIHALGTTVSRATTAPDTIKGALYLASGSLSPTTVTSYSPTSEVSGTGYTAGGQVVTNANPPSTSGNSGIWTPSAALVWTGLTLSTAFDTLLLYNVTQSNYAIELLNFGSQTITSGTLTLNMPANAPSTALLQLT